MPHDGRTTDHSASQIDTGCEYPLAKPVFECVTLECRCRRGKTIYHTRRQIELHKLSEEISYDYWIRQAEMRRWDRHELGPQQLADEGDSIIRQIKYLETFPRTLAGDQQIAAYEKDLAQVTRLIRRMKGITPVPRHDRYRIDWEAIRYVDLQGYASTLLGQAGHPQGENLVFLCPFHNEDHPSLVVYPPGRGWKCFGCGKGGQDAASFAAEWFRVSQVKGAKMVMEMCDVGPRSADEGVRDPGGTSDGGQTVVVTGGRGRPLDGA